MHTGTARWSCALLAALLGAACGHGPEARDAHSDRSPRKVENAVAPVAPSVARGAACKGIRSTFSAPTVRGAAIAAKVDFADTGCVVASDFAGANYVGFPGWGADVSMSAFQKKAFAAAGLQLLRYPGGTPGDWVDLLMTGKCKEGEPTNWRAPAYASLWAFAKSAGMRALMLQTNPTPQWCAEGAQDASGKHAGALAADAKSKGVPVVFEVGNEPDLGNGWFQANGGRDAYIAKFIAHAKAIHAANPGAEVYGPAVCGLGGNCTFPVSWDSGWVDAFLAQTGDKAAGEGKATVDGLSLHVYWHPEFAFSDLAEAKIGKYGFARYWANTVMPYLRALIAKHDSRDLPIAISEISIGNGIADDPKQTQNTFSALETADTIAAFASSGVRSFQWFDANTEGPANFWLITGDALLPNYFAFVLWSKMGDHVLDVSANANPDDVAVYATKRGQSVQVLVINKTDSPHQVAISFAGFNPVGLRRSVYTVRPAVSGTDSSLPVYNDAANPSVDALPAPRTSVNQEATPSETLPPYTMAVIALE